jgi:hypothetical protein
MAATLDVEGWELESGVQLHAQFPETFKIPSEPIRSGLVPRCHAKLVFRMKTDDGRVVVERMWVHITGYTDDGYEGVLDNEADAKGVPLSLGDRVSFQPDHVVDALPPDNWNPATGQYEDR